MNQGNEDYSRVLPTCEQTPLNSNESADPTSILHSKTLDKSTESQSKESRQKTTSLINLASISGENSSRNNENMNLDTSQRSFRLKCRSSSDLFDRPASGLNSIYLQNSNLMQKACEEEKESDKVMYQIYGFHDKSNGPGLPIRKSSGNIAIVEGQELSQSISLENSVRKMISVNGVSSPLNHEKFVAHEPTISESQELTSTSPGQSYEESNDQHITSTSDSDADHHRGRVIDADLYLSLARDGFAPTAKHQSWLSKIIDSISSKMHHSKSKSFSSQPLGVGDSKVEKSEMPESIKIHDTTTSSESNFQFFSKAIEGIQKTKRSSSVFPVVQPTFLINSKMQDMAEKTSRQTNSSQSKTSKLNSSPGGISHLSQSLTSSELENEKDFVPTFSKWKEDKLIGKGSSSTVHLGHIESYAHQDMLCAIKGFRKKRKDETAKEYSKKVVGEFCISSSLHHPNIVIAYDLIHKEDNRYYEVMEYCEGGDLHSFLSKVPVSNDKANYFFTQIMRGVAYMHELGVAHRDLKLENILLDKTQTNVKITDFGCACVYKTVFERNPRKLTGIVGTDPYIAPEEWIPEAEYDPPKVDIWSCGIIFFALVHRTVPWKISKISDSMYNEYIKRRDCGYAPFESVADREFKGLLYSMLDPEASARIDSKTVLKICESSVMYLKEDL